MNRRKERGKSAEQIKKRNKFHSEWPMVSPLNDKWSDNGTGGGGITVGEGVGW